MTMGEMEWTNDLVYRLLKEYRNRPQLWDATHSMYRVNTLKYEAWRELAAIFEVEVTDLRKKLNSVLASHRRELKRVRGGRKSTWFLYPYLDFLQSHIDDSHLDDTPTKRSEEHNSNASTNAGSSADEKESETDHEGAVEFEREEIIIKDEPKNGLRNPITRPIPRLRGNQMISKPRLKRNIIKKRIVKETHSNQSEGTLSEVARLLRRANIRRTKDSCDSFGEYIADSLRKHGERTQAMIKQAINNIIFEQEMKMYRSSNSNDNEYTVVISGMDDNPLV